MCVIAYHAKDVKFMSKDRVNECWDENPDGAGVMWRRDDGKIEFVKGFMKKNKLVKWIEKNRKMLDSHECAIHFRITTHGGTNKGNCHPFVCDSDVDSHILSGVYDTMLMHNGVMPITPRKKDISDSAELALRVGMYEEPSEVMGILDEFLVGNRVIVMGKGGTKMYGDQWKKVDDSGILYSNDYFVNHFSGVGFSSCYRGRSWYDDDGYDYFEPAKIGTRNSVGNGFIYWDSNRGKWICSQTNQVVSLEDVDPDALSESDYDEYLNQWYEGDYGEQYNEFMEEVADDVRQCI